MTVNSYSIMQSVCRTCLRTFHHHNTFPFQHIKARNLPIQPTTLLYFSHSSFSISSTMSATNPHPIQPTKRVSSQRQDVWSIINSAAAQSPHSMINMGQGAYGYNPPSFILDAARSCLDRVECNQYSPTRGRPRLRKALAKAYSAQLGWDIDAEKEVVVTSGANEGMLSAFMAFVEQGDEVVVFEPFFDQYISNIEMPGGKVVYVPLHPPKDGGDRNTSSRDWKFDIAEFEKRVTNRTKMVVLNSPHNPVGKIFSEQELRAIADICVAKNILILSDEVYDSLYYTTFTRIASMSPGIRRITLTVGSGGKLFYATGWRVGWLIGPQELIDYVAAAHTRICYTSVSPLQEAVAMGFEQAENNGFWDKSRADMQGKMKRFNEIWHELNIPYSEPDGGYFVMANLKKVKIPEGYDFPVHVANRPRDFKLAWFLIMELGIAAIPPTEFFTDENAHIVEDWLRFSVCKEDHVLDAAKEKLRALKKYIAT